MKQKQYFNNPLLARLAQTNPVVAISLYYTVSLCIIVYGIYILSWKLLGGVQSMLVFIGGVLTYTLVEYAMHRFVYHSGEDYKNEGSWQYKVHGVHHALPQEKELIALPIPLAVMIALLFYMIFSLLLGRQVYFFFSGFLAGYATYLYVHFLVHTRRPPKNVFKYLWRHHLIHHYSDDDKAFGVSSPLWDIIFGTMPQDASVYRNKRFSKDH